MFLFDDFDLDIQKVTVEVYNNSPTEVTCTKAACTTPSWCVCQVVTQGANCTGQFCPTISACSATCMSCRPECQGEHYTQECSSRVFCR